jgi:hypothetical protein
MVSSPVDGEMKDTLKPPTKINGMCSYIPVGQTPETWVNYGLYMDREFHSIKLIPGELMSSHFINPSGIGSQTAPQTAPALPRRWSADVSLEA